MVAAHSGPGSPSSLPIQQRQTPCLVTRTRATRHDARMSRVLTDAEVDAALRTLPGWTRREAAIHASFKFRDFAAAFAFMTEVAAAAEQLNHHPDWSNSWSRVEISLTTHDSGGITERDLSLARRIQSLATPAQ